MLKLALLILQFDVLLLSHFYSPIGLLSMVDAWGSQAVLPQLFEVKEIHGGTWRPLEL